MTVLYQSLASFQNYAAGGVSELKVKLHFNNIVAPLWTFGRSLLARESQRPRLRSFYTVVWLKTLHATICDNNLEL